MRLPRSSGVLLPLFSLPGCYGIGDPGPNARRFVDFLAAAGQSIWQVLPLSPTARGNSPYSSYSAFAGSPFLISPELLHADGLITSGSLESAALAFAADAPVDYSHASKEKQRLLRESFRVFSSDNHHPLREAFELFCSEQSDWLHDFACYEALANHFNEQDWSRWDNGLRIRDTDAVRQAEQSLADEIQYSCFVQFLFLRQWDDLKEYANGKNVRLYGDMPIFVAYESADVWINQHLFCLDDDGKPTVVAGVPPDYFSATGQKWGNPLYRWDRLAENSYDWWVRRIRHSLRYFDVLRIDHFRGFESYWEIPAEAENAITGEWRTGPRDDLFAAVMSALGELPIVAEDLGLITDEVHQLRDRVGFPGMRVLQFGFEHEHDGYHRPDCYPEHCVAYTGTHDNDTAMGWYLEKFSEGPNEILTRFLSGDDGQIHKDLIRSVLNSAADTAILPMQDIIGLDGTARMNTPGVPDGNWLWRCDAAYLNEATAAELRSWTEASGRA